MATTLAGVVIGRWASGRALRSFFFSSRRGHTSWNGGWSSDVCSSDLSGAGVPLVLPPGVYRAGRLELPTGTHLIGMPGATRLILAQGGPLASTNNADYLTLSGLSFESNGSPLPDQHGLLHLKRGRRIRIEHCEVIAAGGHGILLEHIEGEIAGNTIVGPR